MPEYVATFFTHYDAIVFCRSLEKLAITGKMMPVPRKLSSSCGTCVSFSDAELAIEKIPTGDLERLVQKLNNNYIDIVDNR